MMKLNMSSCDPTTRGGRRAWATGARAPIYFWNFLNNKFWYLYKFPNPKNMYNVKLCVCPRLIVILDLPLDPTPVTSLRRIAYPTLFPSFVPISSLIYSLCNTHCCYTPWLCNLLYVYTVTIHVKLLCNLVLSYDLLQLISNRIYWKILTNLL